MFPLVAELIMIEDKDVRLLVKRFVKKSVEFRELLPRDGWRIGKDVDNEIENVMNGESEEMELNECSSALNALAKTEYHEHSDQSIESKTSFSTFSDKCFSTEINDHFETDMEGKAKGASTPVLKVLHVDSGTA